MEYLLIVWMYTNSLTSLQPVYETAHQAYGEYSLQNDSENCIDRIEST